MEDWRRDQAVRYAQRMLSTCEPCPEAECGAQVCGDEEKRNHVRFHKQVRGLVEERDKLRGRLTMLEEKMLGGNEELQQAIQALQGFAQDKNKIQNRLTMLEQSLIAERDRLTSIEESAKDLDKRLKHLEPPVDIPTDIIPDIDKKE